MLFLDFIIRQEYFCSVIENYQDYDIIAMEFKTTMSHRTFLLQIKCFIRTDDNLRPGKEIPMTLVRDIGNIEIQKFTEFYMPSTDIMIDEQLFEYHERCQFRQYINSKFRRFGLKIFWACDSKTNFALNSFVYTGESTLTKTNKIRLLQLMCANFFANRFKHNLEQLV